MQKKKLQDLYFFFFKAITWNVRTEKNDLCYVYKNHA